MSTPDRYGQGKATLITQHEHEAEPVDDEVRWADIKKAITKAMDEGQE